MVWDVMWCGVGCGMVWDIMWDVVWCSVGCGMVWDVVLRGI